MKIYIKTCYILCALAVGLFVDALGPGLFAVDVLGPRPSPGPGPSGPGPGPGPRLGPAQADSALKAAGTSSIGGFIGNSKTLLVAWYQSYFQRLWCPFVDAAFKYGNPNGKV